MERMLEPYELTDEEIWGIEEDTRKDEKIDLYHRTLEDVYEIVTHIEDYEGDIKEIKDLIQYCEIEAKKIG